MDENEILSDGTAPQTPGKKKKVILIVVALVLALAAVAAAILLFVIVLTITCINLLVSRKHVHYV